MGQVLHGNATITHATQKGNPRGPRGGLKQRVIKALWNPLRNRKEVAVARFGRKP